VRERERERKREERDRDVEYVQNCYIFKGMTGTLAPFRHPLVII
jgi:hypothetical protein